MTEDKIALRALLEKGSDATFLREMIGFAAQRLMELESESLCGARIMRTVGNTTTLLVVVSERPFSVGIRGSAKYLRAEELIAAGSSLKIISLSEARAMIAKAT